MEPESTRRPALEVDGLTKQYKTVLAANQVRFEVWPGDRPEWGRKDYHHPDDFYPASADFGRRSGRRLFCRAGGCPGAGADYLFA